MRLQWLRALVGFDKRPTMGWRRNQARNCSSVALA